MAAFTRSWWLCGSVAAFLSIACHQLVGIANAMLAGLEPPLSSFGLPDYGGELAGLRG